jgi:hypothetical protein
MPDLLKLKYLTQSSLKERGWTDKLILNVLVAPDLLKPNPHYKAGPQMKLFLEERVLTGEASEEFKNHTINSVKRKEGAKKATQTKKDKIIAYVNSVEVKIPDYATFKTLKKLACNKYDAHYRSRGRYVNKCDTLFVNRVVVNFLRHQCDEYEEGLVNMFGKVGIDTGYVMLKNKVLDAIAEKYPLLKDECLNQRIDLSEYLFYINEPD